MDKGNGYIIKLDKERKIKRNNESNKENYNKNKSI